MTTHTSPCEPPARHPVTHPSQAHDSHDTRYVPIRAIRCRGPKTGRYSDTRRPPRGYRKPSHCLTKDSLQADGADTVLALRDLHPQGDLHLNRQHWPTPDQVKARWDTPECQELLEKQLSVKVFRDTLRAGQLWERLTLMVGVAKT